MGTKTFHNNVQVRGFSSANGVRFRVLAGGAIAANKFVSLSSYDSSTGLMTVVEASDFKNVIGFAPSAISNGEYGEVVYKGVVDGLQSGSGDVTISDGLVAGEKVYLADGSGSVNVTDGASVISGPYIIAGTIVAVNAATTPDTYSVSFDLSSVAMTTGTQADASATGIIMDASNEGVFPALSLASLTGLGAAPDGADILIVYDQSTGFHRSLTVTELLSAASSTFVGLSDTPANFTGAANQVLRVNGAGDAVEFVAILDEDDMSSDSATGIASQQSIKAYVDNSIGDLADGIIRKAAVAAIIEDASAVAPTVGNSAAAIPAGHARLHDVAGDGTGDWDLYIHDINTGLWVAGPSKFAGRAILKTSAIGYANITAGTAVANDIVTFTGGVLSDEETPSEGWIVYVDNVDEEVALAPSGTDAIFVSDGLVTAWELRDHHAKVTLTTDSSDVTLSGQALTINQVTTSTDGVMIASDKAKLDRINNLQTKLQLTGALGTLDTVSSLTNSSEYSITWEYVARNVTNSPAVETGKIQAVISVSGAGVVTADFTRESTNVLGTADLDDLSFSLDVATANEIELIANSAGDDFDIRVSRVETIELTV